MPRREQAISAMYTALVLLVTLAALAQGGPVPREHDDDDDSKPRPLIEFTKGGFRVNFGGFHAAAGLGGLLTGDTKDGGLFASAGTPSGAHASAGLGGSLSEGPSGGLYARAGLGNGGPEAATGLGGSLGGPKPGGEIYAEADRGNFPEIPKIQKNKGKNIQVITPPKKVDQAMSDVASNDNGEKVSKTKESPSSSSASPSASASTNVAVSADDGIGKRVTEDLKTQHPARWYFEKRLRERIGDKTTSDNVIIASPTSEAHQEQAESSKLLDNSVRSKHEASIDTTANANVNANANIGTGSNYANGYKYKYKNGSLFDDIFNIPISALKAVNQLLKNHVGRA